MNICEAGHDKHDSHLVNTNQGYKMYVFNAGKYKDTEGYCTGDDDVSRTIEKTRGWEPAETAVLKNILENEPVGNVLDFGTHVGWYSLMAAKLGHTVYGFDGDDENIELLYDSAVYNKLDGKVTVVHSWVDENSPKIKADKKYLLMKCDLEGNDIYAVEMCRELFAKRYITYAFIEISPIFNDKYQGMIDFITACGYSVEIVDPDDGVLKPWNGKFDFDQANMLFTRSER